MLPTRSFPHPRVSKIWRCAMVQEVLWQAGSQAVRERIRGSSPCHHRWATGQSALGFNAGDTNLYRYVQNSPTNRRDPSGLVAEMPEALPANIAQRLSDLGITMNRTTGGYQSAN